MKTARFSELVKACGQPETHLVLTDPRRDKILQTAIKANRVLTVYQETVGSKADRGEIGFHPGPTRQFLIFPRSLRRFADRTIVGIKYELLVEGSPAPKKKPVAPAKSKPPAKTKPLKRPQPSAHPAKNIVAFPAEDGEDEAIADLKKQVRHAMNVLEAGKPVAAFNLLKRIVE